MKEDQVEYAIKEILHSIGEDVGREGLLKTPERFARYWKEFLSPPKFEFTTFKNEGNDEMIVVKDIPFYSLCEHHLVPFFGTAHIAYIPNGSICGLSKIPRTLDMFARRLQNQERITMETANYLLEHLKPKGVAVVIEARHLCMEMRGVEKPGTVTKTSAMMQCFKTEMNCRQEFLNLIK